MNRVGFLKFAILSLLIFSVITTSSSAQAEETSLPPVLYDTSYICPGGFIYDTLAFNANNLDDPLVEMKIIDGPGNLEVERLYDVDTIKGYYSYAPESEGTVTVTFMIVNRFADSLYFVYNYTTFFTDSGTVVSIQDQNFSSVACDLNSIRELQIIADGDNLVFNLLSGIGSIDPTTGLLSYEPDTSGTFEFLVEVYNGCNSDTALITDMVHLNTPPQVFCYDSLVTLCEADTICFDVLGLDPDGDPVQLFMLEGIGEFNMTSDSTGRACFLPADVDSAVYRFIFRGADSCELVQDKNPPSECCRDTSLITVVINRPPVLTCPEPQNFFSCDSSEFCFEISAFDYEEAELTYNILSQNATIENNLICVSGNESGQFDVVIEVVDDCGYADTCTVPVTIDMNNPPVVTSAEDFSINLCAPEQICFSVVIDDLDNNIASVLTNFGSYTSENGMICFTPDTTGVYSITTIVTDSCGLVDSATTLVTVTMNENPTISLGSDFETTVCAEQEICIDPVIFDDGQYNVYTNFSFYNAETGLICFTPDSSGVYTIIADIVDDCEITVTDTIQITVTLKELPFVNLGDADSVSLCMPEELCYPIETNIPFAELTSNFGTINPETGEICFTPDSAGAYSITVEGVDSCGQFVSATQYIIVDFNSAPVVANLNDTLVYLCQPQSICLPVDISDVDGDIASIVVNRGSYNNGEICFVPYDKGGYEIIVTVTDSCGNIAADTAYVQVVTDQDVNVIVPNDTSFFTCELDTFCFPVSGIPDNAEVTVTGINTWYNAETGMVCYYAECSNKNLITLTVSTPCNTFTKSFNVTVNCNTDPLAILPQDTTIFQCINEEITIPVGVSDADHNLMSIDVTGGVYDPVMHVIRFTPDTAGVYVFSVTATDSCEAVDYDEMIVVISQNNPPTCSVPSDTLIELCEPGQIQLPVSAFDPDGNLFSCEIISGGGEIVDGNWVYNAITDDSVVVTIRCTDECGEFCESTFTVYINVNSAPVWTGEAEFSYEFCEPTEITIPLSAFDVNGEMLTFELVDGPGMVIDSSWVFTPTEAGMYEFAVRVSDECNAFAEKTFTVNVSLNDAPIVDAGEDFSTFLCEPGEVCFDVTIVDDNRAYSSIPKGYFNWSKGQYCFYADTSGVYEIVVSATDSCNITTYDTILVTVDINSAPVCDFVLPNEILSFCDSATASVLLNTFDADSNQTTCEIISGPGEIIDGSWVYTSYATETVEVTIRCTDECGAFCESSFSISFEKNELPTIEDQQFAESYCLPNQLRSFYVAAFDADDENITYSLESGPGSIDPITGFITYSPDTAGTYTFVVSVSDECGSASATITDVIGINNPPVYSGYDSTIYLCSPEEICFDIMATDPDGDPIILSQYSGLGQFTQLTDSTGQTCFMPEDVDTMTYTFTYCVTDSCGDYPDKFIEPNCDLEVNITVIINRAPELTCPPEMNFFACEVDSFCFEISGFDPDGNELTYNILSGNASYTNGIVCVTGDSSSAFDVVVEVVDACGAADTCTVPVNIDANRPPVVTTADDFEVDFCESEEICFETGISDLDNNFDFYELNFGTYNSETNLVCFTPDSAGVYMIVLSATDSCGAFGADTTYVTVDLNEIPFIDAGEDFAISLCAPGDVCFDVTIIDDNRAYTSIPNGFYNWNLEQYCFNADTSGVYTIVVSVTDSCGIKVSDTVNVTVSISEGPFVNLGDDLDLFRCDNSEICIDVETIANYTDLVVTGGAVFNSETSQICFLPEGPGSYQFAVSVTDTCGLIATDTINVNVSFNDTPIVSQMPDTTVYLCSPTSICLPLSIDDNNIASITTNMGSYSNGQVCFVPYDSGMFTIIATIVDSCGITIVDTANVHVKTDQGIQITGQKDTTIFVCELDTMCFPIYGIPENAEVSVSGINVIYNSENSTVCFVPECALSNKITVTASTPCGDYKYTFTVTIRCNSAPLVILPQDTAMVICEPSDICLPVGITDVDKNLGSVEVTYGTYDPVLHRICFPVDTAGTYIVGVTATDTCGASDYDEVIVNVSLNEAPEIFFNSSDTVVYESCDSNEVCVPITVSDPDNNLVSITSSNGYYNAESNSICFVPQSSGEVCIVVTVADACGLTAIDTVCVQVEVGGYAVFECPTNNHIVADSVCGPSQICVPLNISGEITDFGSTMGTYENGQLCFFADTAGLYTITSTVYGDCNEVTCTYTVEVNWISDVAISCPSDIDTLLCGPDTLCFTYSTTDAESVMVSSPAYFSGGDSEICLPIDTAGIYVVTLTAMGACGIDTCSFTVDARFNSAPTIVTQDTTLTVCAIDSICVPFEVLDIDSNVVQVTTSLGVINENTVCFLPLTYGQSSIVITAVDECGAQRSKTVNINLIQGASALITCPQDQFATLCGPDSVCVLVPITPLGADITILENGQPANANYNPETGSLCLYVESEGTRTITVIADAFCASDTCSFEVTATVAQPPSVSCPTEIDTLLCLPEPDSFCFPIEIAGTGVEVTVNPAGSYAAGYVCIPVDTAGIYDVEIIASSDCGADTCFTSVAIAVDAPPIVEVPNDTTIFWCPQDTGSVCIEGISGSDPTDFVSISLGCGPGTYHQSSVNSGAVCFTPTAPGQYMFCIDVSDGCNVTTDSFYVDVVEKDDCDVCVRASISVTDPTPVGVEVDVFVNVETNTAIAGFDVLISFDASVMTFSNATTVGTEISDWEYFTYRLGSEDCGSGCPSGLVRLVGIADINNGPIHPPVSAYEPNGALVQLTFLIANDQNLGDQFLPIDFVWYDCGDNTFSNISGNLLYMDTKIFNSENVLLWDEEDDALFPESNRPFGMGARDICMVGASAAPIRCVEFINGGIKVVHPDSIDARGDINLNSVPYDIGDAVLYSNYFIYGLSVFTVNLAGQIAASDVNADGLTLSVADLVLMIRIIVGDADPIPKLTPYDQSLLINTEQSDNRYLVSSESVSDIGAAHFVYQLRDDIRIDDVILTSESDQMTLGYDVSGDQLRILIYDIGNNMISKGENELFEIRYSGSGSVALAESEIVDYNGRPYHVAMKGGSLPNGFELAQNYPNPFNPTTKIELSLPSQTDWRIMIFNINGSLVREFEGADEAGRVSIEWDATDRSGRKVASGVYLYKVVAGQFSDTKKMILLK